MDLYSGFLLLTCCLHTVLAGVGGCQPKKASGLCLKDANSNTLTIEFKLDLTTSPQGLLAVEPMTNGHNCPITHNITTNIYSMTEKINLNNRNPVASPITCGASYEASTKSYTWTLLYYKNAERIDTDMGCNRKYTIVCSPDDMTELQVTASITASVPDLNVPVTPYKPNVELFLEGQISGIFTRLNPNTEVPVQTLLRLVLQLKDIDPLDLTKMSSIAGLKTLVDDNVEFSTPTVFFEDSGCTPVGSALSPTTAFVFDQTTELTTSRRVTGAFPAFMFDRGSNLLVFQTKFAGCYGPKDTIAFCNNPCGNPIVRKKRDAQEEEPDYVTVSVRIVARTDPDKVSGDNDTILFAAVGACIGICVLLIAMLAVMLFVVRRRRSRNAEEKKVPPHVFANETKTPY